MVNGNSKQSGPWWKPAMQVFSEVSTWIAVPIIGALIGGKALDAHYGTKPLWLLVCAGLGFVITGYGITKSVRQFAARTKDQTEDQTGK